MRQGVVSANEKIERDQWSLGGLDAHRPLYRVELDDAAGSMLYISSRTGCMHETVLKQISFWVYVFLMFTKNIFQHMARRSNVWWATAFCQFRPSISPRSCRAVTASDCASSPIFGQWNRPCSRRRQWSQKLAVTVFPGSHAIHQLR